MDPSFFDRLARGGAHATEHCGYGHITDFDVKRQFHAANI
jgi:hypothetical protein